MPYFRYVIKIHLSRDCDWILPHPRGVPWPLECKIYLSFSLLSSSPVNTSLLLYTDIQTNTQGIIYLCMHGIISLIMVTAIPPCFLQRENYNKYYWCLAQVCCVHFRKKSNNKETNKQQNKTNPKPKPLKWRNKEFLWQEANFLPLNITTSHLWPIAMTPSMYIVKQWKNLRSQLTPRVSDFVISSTLSSGSLKGHYKNQKSTNDIMQTSPMAYSVAQHIDRLLSILGIATIVALQRCRSIPSRDHQMKTCFMLTKCRERYGGKKIISECLKTGQRNDA